MYLDGAGIEAAFVAGGQHLEGIRWGRSSSFPQRSTPHQPKWKYVHVPNRKMSLATVFLQRLFHLWAEQQKDQRSWEEGKANAKHVSNLWKCGSRKSPEKGFWLRGAGRCRAPVGLPLQERSFVSLACKQGCPREKPDYFICFFSQWRILNP